MKRHFQTVGVRNWAGDDLVELQSEPLAALDAFFSEYGPCVLQGCEITESADGAGTFDIAPGLVVLEADNQADGTHRAMVMPFLGAAGVALPLYLTPAVEVLTDVYADGKSKPVAYAYTAQAAGVDPGEAVPHLTITADGGNRFVDAVQDAGHRFISDDERAKWNRILDQAKAYADSVAAVGSEAALRNAKEYIDSREVAILAAADTKDEATLRTAKEYADRIVAALAGSAPEVLDTLEELAAALGNDPNFSATVMQMIGERVTTEALAAALAGKADKNGDASEMFNASIVKAGYLNLTKNGTSNYMYIGRGDEISSSYKSTDEVIHNSVGRVVLAGVGDPVSVDSNNMAVRIIWHSGNLNPTLYLKRDVKGWRKETNCDNMTQEGTYDINSSEVSFVNCPFRDYGQIVVFRTSAAIAQLAFQYASGNLFVRTKYDYSAFSPWRAVYHSNNLKPTYYAQINPRGGIISKSADWIQSVTWKSDGNGMQCYILPKVTVNLATAHVTKVRTGGNGFKGRAPVVCDELLGGCIVVATPGDNGASEEDYFNISIQGA